MSYIYEILYIYIDMLYRYVKEEENWVSQIKVILDCFVEDFFS